MSGGVTYVWDKDKDFIKQCNAETYELEQVCAETDIKELHTLISNHYRYTDSTVAKQILEHWEESLKQFVKVMPTDYKRVLAERAATQENEAAAV